MGEILSIKRDKEKTFLKMKISMQEFFQLRGHLKKVHLFQKNSFKGKAKIVKRGIGGGAKYFEMPLLLKSRKKNKFYEISYQKLPLENKVYYIFVGNNEFEKNFKKC